MARVNGPLMSMDASGALGGTVVFSKWKGRNYVRQLVRPANPKSGGQTSMRAMMKFLSQQWSGLQAADKASWEDLAESLVISPFNAFTKTNLARNKDFLAPSTDYPAAEATAPDAIDDFAAVAGVRSITIELSTVPLLDGCWGFLLFRSTTTGFTPAFDNLIAVVEADADTSVYYVDTPLTADTYYYDAKPFNEDGKLGSLDGEINATVT